MFLFSKMTLRIRQVLAVQLWSNKCSVVMFNFVVSKFPHYLVHYMVWTKTSGVCRNLQFQNLV